MTVMTMESKHALFLWFSLELVSRLYLENFFILARDDDEVNVAIDRVLKKYDKAPVVDLNAQGSFNERHERSVRRSIVIVLHQVCLESFFFFKY